jgi:hypothetical protein
MAALFLGAVAGREAISRLQPQPTSYARAIIQGEETARGRDVDSNDDAIPPDDGYALGAMWARFHHPSDAAECPDPSKAFRAGCAAWIEAVRP